MPTPILFTLTDAGLNAALAESATGLSLSLKHVAVGRGQYTADASRTTLNDEFARFVLSGGGIESASKTLRFTAVLESNSTEEVFEIGLFTDAGVLFAVASTTDADPLVLLSAGVAFVASFGLSITALPDDSVTVVVDPNAAVFAVLLQQHLAAADPHPQYATDTDLAALGVIVDANDAQNTLEHNNILQLIAAANLARFNGDQQLDLRLTAHEQAADPHQQYLRKIDYLGRYLFKRQLEYNVLFSSHLGGVTNHHLETEVIEVNLSLAQVAQISASTAKNQNVINGVSFAAIDGDVFLSFKCFVRIRSYTSQGDSNWSGLSVKLVFVDQNDSAVQEIELTTAMSGAFGGNGDVRSADIRAYSDDFLRVNIPNIFRPRCKLVFAVTTDDGGNGSADDRHIVQIDGVTIACEY